MSAPTTPSIPELESYSGNRAEAEQVKQLRRIEDALGAVVANDGGISQTTSRGVSGVPYTSADRSASAASVTDAPTSGQKLVITDILFSCDTAMSVTFKEETSGTVIHGPLYFPANSTQQITLRGKTKLPVANKKLQAQTSVAGNISVEAIYYSEA